MKKKIGVITFYLAGALLLTGCGQKIPEMSINQSEQVAEFAASLLMRYDQNNPSRLLSDAALEVELQRLKVVAEKKALIQTQEQARLDQKEKEKAEREQANQDSSTSEVGQEAVVPQYIEEFYGIDGFQIRYQGYQVTDSFPDASESEYFSMTASKGKKLVVLEFLATNVTDAEKELNMISIEPKFSVDINSQGTKSALPTILLDDITNYKGNISPAGNVKLVIITQVAEEEARNISSILVTMKNESASATTFTE